MIYRSSLDEIIVNFEDEIYFQTDDVAEIEECRHHVNTLLKYSKRLQLNEKASKAIDFIIDRGVVLPPEFFLGKNGNRLNRRIAHEFVTRTALGLDLFETLGEHGLSALIEKKAEGWHRDSLKLSLMQVIAAFTMMVCGPSNIDEIPKEVMSDILDYYRTQDGLRWRSNLLNSEEIGVTCFREITRALGSLYNDNDILGRAKQNRIRHGSVSNWKYIVENPTALQADLLRYHSEFTGVSLARPANDRQLIMDLDKFLSEKGYSSLREALAKPFPKNALTEYYRQRNGSLSAYFLLMVRSARKLSEFLVSELEDDFPGTQFFPLVTDSEVSFAANLVGDRAQRRTQAAARPMAERYHFLAKQILDEGAEGWPGTKFTVDIMKDGVAVPTYCPVIPTLLRAAMEIPLRMVQLRRLDSGEGDERRFNGATMTWQDNLTRNRGYWVGKKLAQANETRGYAFEFTDSEPRITGFFVNTNKTGAPYTIPWMSTELHKILWDLSEWQIAENRVDGPTEPSEYADGETPEARLKVLPSIFALFRMPPTAKNPRRGVPPSPSLVNKAFIELMVEVERRWNELNPEGQVSLGISYNKKTGQATSCAYTLPGLRVRGITNLFRANVPIEMLSKIVAGHATIMMTLYYILFDPLEVNQRINDAFLAANSSEVSKFTDDLKRMRIEEAKKKTTFLNESAVEAAITFGDHNQFCNVDIGVCPFDGTRCSDGGELLRKDKSGGKSAYGPVRGGPRNCIMCRHFISGTPFIMQLELYGSKLLWKRSEIARKQEEQRVRLNALHQSRRDGSITPDYFRNALDRLRVENNELKDTIEEIDNAIFNVKLHLDAASKLLAQGTATNETSVVHFVSNGSTSTVGYVEWSAFDVAVTLSAASRVWTILRDEALENTKRQFIDQILFNSALPPLSMRADLSAEQKQMSVDALAQFLMTRVSNSERRSLTEGRSKLHDLRIEKQVQNLIDQVVLVPAQAPAASNMTLINHSEF
jgi:hypothetical protein